MEPLEPQPGKPGYSYDPEGDKLSKSLYKSMIQSSKEIEFRNRNNQKLDDKIGDNEHVPDENKKPHKCSICEYSTSKETDLKRHIKSVHEGKPLHCSICNYSTSREQDLKRHQSVHGVKRPYKCKDCNADFRTNKGLTQHLKSY